MVKGFESTKNFVFLLIAASLWGNAEILWSHPSFAAEPPTGPITRITPQRNYGFTYEKSETMWNGQKLLEIKFFRKNDGEEKESLLDQLFVIRATETEGQKEVKTRRYDEAEKTCTSLPRLTSETSLEFIDRDFQLPYDYQAFFLVDENLIKTERTIALTGNGDGSSSPLTLQSINAFWTQGPFEPGSLSTFKLDSNAGYIIGKNYRLGFMMGFEETIAFEEQMESERLEQARLLRRISKFEALMNDDTEADAESHQAYREQIRLAKEKLSESLQQVTLAQIKKEGLEIHCVAGGRLPPEAFLFPLMEKSLASR